MNIKEILEESDPTIQFRFSKEKPKKYFSIEEKNIEYDNTSDKVLLM